MNILKGILFLLLGLFISYMSLWLIDIIEFDKDSARGLFVFIVIISIAFLSGVTGLSLFIFKILDKNL